MFESVHGHVSNGSGGAPTPSYLVRTFSSFRGLNFNHANTELNKDEVCFENLNI